MVRVSLYVEGGGEIGQQNKYLAIEMRRAFKRFLTNSGIPDNQFNVVRCGSRDQAYQKFCSAIQDSGSTHFPLLLVDSEEAVPAKTNPWDHLKQRDKWDKPTGAEDIHVHLMVQCMESWFLADKQKLVGYYGQGFQIASVPATQPVESAMKEDILSALSKASQRTTKGSYSKGNHSFAILESLDPEKVAQASPWACRMLQVLGDKLNIPKSNRKWTKCTVPEFSK
ncbi:MAG: DUF4276 family protein [Magnetococcales bacterium]|nr:DUF4276 family protein [Magnetococcales bacterium]